MRKRIVPVFLLLLLTAIRSAAQQTDLDPVTVTATMNPARLSQTGRNLFVINADKLAALPFHSLDELLRYLPGIEVQARGPFGSQSDVVMRGGTFQQVLIIIDGLRVNDPNTGHFTTYIPVAPTEIERVEILKGASSALYGSDAVGGVINIITKTFAAKQSAKSKEGVLQITGGEYGTLAVDAGLARANGNTAWSVGGQIINTAGQAQRGIRGFVESENGTASVGHYFKRGWQVALRTSVDKRKFGAQNFYTAFVSDTAQETVTSFWNQLQVIHMDSTHTFRVEAGYKNLVDSFSFNPKTPTNQNKSNLWQVLVTDERQVNKRASIIFSGQAINKKIRSNDRGNHSVNTLAASVILNQQISTRFTVSPAARIEWNEISKTEFVPQINLSYRTAKAQLRGSAGKTVRDADFTERYNNYNNPFVGSGRIGNPALQPERSFSYEAGADYFATNNLKLSGTFFQRHHKMLIDYVTTLYADMPRKENLSPTGVYALAKNIAQVKTTGLEADVQFSKPLANGSLRATLGLIWLDSESSDATPSLYVSSHAKFLTNFTVIYNYKNLTVSISGLYKTRPSQMPAAPVLAKVSQDYALLNAKAGATIWKGLNCFIEIDNLTNSLYTDLLGAQMPHRWLMGGLKIHFSK